MYAETLYYPGTVPPATNQALGPVVVGAAASRDYVEQRRATNEGYEQQRIGGKVGDRLKLEPCSTKGDFFEKRAQSFDPSSASSTRPQTAEGSSRNHGPQTAEGSGSGSFPQLSGLRIGEPEAETAGSDRLDAIARNADALRK